MAASRILTETPGSGKPTVPARRSPSYGLLMFISVSLIPYRSRIVWPNFARKASNTLRRKRRGA